MITRKTPYVDLTKFPGANQRLSQTDAVRNGAKQSLNMQYRRGQTRTRRGFGEAVNINRLLTNIYSWKLNQFNRLLMLENASNVISRDLATDAETILLSSLSGVAGMSYAPVGGFAYFAFQDSSGDGASQPYVWDGLTTLGLPHMDKCFQRPLLDSEFSLSSATLSLPAGYSPPTLGDHNVAVVITTRTGYETKPSPVNASAVLQPLLVTCDGSDAYTITLTPASTWPEWVDRAYLLVTTVSNRERYYFAPDIWADIGAGSAIPVNLSFVHTDTSIEAGREATALFDTLSQDMSGDGPFDCQHVVEGSDRMCYVAYTMGPLGQDQSAVFISDKNDFQTISLSQHMRQLPGNKSIRTGAWIGNGFYMYGPSYTGSLRDNNLLPIEWGSVEMLDGGIGTRWTHGVTQQPLRSYVWVADQSGLYNFNGASYPMHPISFEQGAEDWQSINNTAPPHVLRVIDDPVEHLVFVIAPLGSSDVATHILVWDYSQAGNPITGIDYRRVNYSKWNLTGIDIGGADRVRNPDTNDLELWIGRETSSGNILRFKSPTDSNLAEDDGAGIPWLYETPLAIYTPDALLDFLAASVTASGSGMLLTSARGMEDPDNPANDLEPLEDIYLDTDSTEPQLLGTSLQSNAISLIFQGTGDTGNRVVLDFTRIYYNIISGHVN